MGLTHSRAFKSHFNNIGGRQKKEAVKYKRPIAPKFEFDDNHNLIPAQNKRYNPFDKKATLYSYLWLGAVVAVVLSAVIYTILVKP